MATQNAYEVVVCLDRADAPLYGTRSATWDAIPAADSAVQYATEAEAEDAIKRLRLDDPEDYADSALRVREIGADSPL